MAEMMASKRRPSKASTVSASACPVVKDHRTVRHGGLMVTGGNGQHACRTVTAYYPMTRAEKICEVVAATAVEVQYVERVVPTQLILDHSVEKPL